jgi:hypothetical protein
MRPHPADTVAETCLAEDPAAARHRLGPTTGELAQLGLFRVGYVTTTVSIGGGVDIVIHAANGMVVATTDSVERAVDVADQLGLAMVPVH